MRKLIGILVISSLVFIGCALPATSDVPSPPNPGNEVIDTGEFILPEEGRPPDDVTWISPGKVIVGNFHPGARAEWPVAIHNGEDTERTFQIRYRNPDRVEEGYIKAPEVVQDWVIVSDPTPILAPRETREVLVIVDMPIDAESPSPRWEFWISIKDISQGGMVQTELIVRWLVRMGG